MIEIFGEPGKPEYDAAIEVRDALVKLWPGLDTSPADEELVRLAANVKLSGYKVSDFDIIVCASLRYGRQFVPRKPINDKGGYKVLNKPVRVANFVAAVEVKDHPAHRIQYSGDKVLVQYDRNEGWKSATDQNIDQVHAVKEYLGHIAREQPYVHRLVLLRGAEQVRIGGALGRGFTGADILTAFAETAQVRSRNGEYFLDSGSNEIISRALNAPIFRKLAATNLDRQRMNRIAVQAVTDDDWTGDLGSKMVRLRGRGGAGKTVFLLQSAWQAFQAAGTRTLLLTYNHALAADIRRCMALLGIPSAYDSGGISVQTVMSFMYSWFRQLGLLNEATDPETEDYETHCLNALQMLREGAVLGSDLSAVKADAPELFDFDYIFVDEAQDWPAPELQLLKQLYGFDRICIADGVDQFVRGGPANWDNDIPSKSRRVVSLQRCLRLKNNLSVFANSVAFASRSSWRLEPNSLAGGGRVIVVKGAYSQVPALHTQLTDAAAATGNAPVDFLLIVPPSDVAGSSNDRRSRLAQHLEKSGMAVWDGTNLASRRDFPRSVDTFRVVQYDSCRGLEGWTVVCDGFDKFWNYKYQQYMLDQSSLKSEEMLTREEAASRFAWQWCFIPLSRPIDTLVICLNDLNSPLSQAVLAAAQAHPDFVEIVEADMTVSS